MRTTVTLDDDAEQVVRRRMRDRRVGFKQALNDAIRAGAPAEQQASFRTPTARLGQASLDLDKALQLAGELEDAELLRKLRAGR